MLITTIFIASVAGLGGAGCIATAIRKRVARKRAAHAAFEAEAAEGRKAHPTAQELLMSRGFELLEGRPRPVPQMRGKLALRPVHDGDRALNCEFTHDAIWRARSDYIHMSNAIFLLEQVASDGIRAEYRPIMQVCQLCLHVYPLAEASLRGTSFEGRVAGRQTLRDVLEDIDAVTLLRERREWLRGELGEIERKLLNAAYASPRRLADHPHRGHPLRLVAGPAETALDDPPDDRAKAMPAIKNA